jgi:hypothetical protein
MTDNNSINDFTAALIDGHDAPDNSTPIQPPPTIRADGWIPIRQRVFLESLAETGVVTQACDDCGMSPRAAYTLRLRSEGIGFRLGWEAAILIARGRLVDELMARAIKGWDEVSTRSRNENEEDTRIRHRFDNRLAMSLLGRLDKRAEVPLTEGTEAALARIVAQDFEAYLDLIGSGAGGAAVSLFLALRTPQTEAQNPAHENDIGQCELCGIAAPGAAHEMTAEEALDARLNGFIESEAASFRAYCEPGEDPEDIASWRCEFPPPPGFDGEEWGSWEGDDESIERYTRELTEQEHQTVLIQRKPENNPLYIAAKIARDLYFGFVPAGEGEEVLPQSIVTSQAGMTNKGLESAARPATNSYAD